jgi:YVTN family beta-propeller protein
LGPRDAVRTLNFSTAAGHTIAPVHRRSLGVVAAALLVLAACANDASRPSSAASSSASDHGHSGSIAASEPPPSDLPPPEPPPPTTPTTIDIYAADRPNQLSPAVALYPSLIYVPNSESNTVDVIDPATMRIVNHFDVGQEPQHVVPSYDLKTLYVAADRGNTLTPINPATGQPGAPIPVEDPYNLYFTPDGRFAIVVAERLARLDFRDPHTFALLTSLSVPCAGVDHLDFSADGSYLIASCEFSSEMVKVALGPQGPSLAGTLPLSKGAKPQDVKLSPDGSLFYVADMVSNGVWELDGNTFTVAGFLPTGAGAHGLYVSRDSKDLYVSDRDEGTVSVVDLATRSVRSKWTIPGGGSPDMGGVSADGRTLWLSGRSNSEVYAFDTTTGELRARIRVGNGPHGLCVYPQPGRFSLGHTGVFR